MDTCGSIFTQGFVSGDDITLNVQFYLPDNVTVKDMTGFKVGMTIKSALEDSQGNPIPDSQALFQQDISGNTTGNFTLLIPGQTAANPTFVPANYYLDIKQWDSTGKRTMVLTSMLPINESVTLRYVP